MDKNSEQAACNGDQHEVDPVDNMDEDAAAKEKLTAGDPNKVKFTTVSLDGYDGKNGEAKVDIHVAQTTVGMGKDELMKYANEPFWVRLRMFLFVFFWIAWIAMLVGAVVIILLAPRCPPAPRLEWYQKTAMYEVNVKTFKDSNDDGVGDFQGLISKLDYLENQNIGTLMLSAFYKSSGDDADAIVQHDEIDDKVGTIADFEELLTQMKDKGIKLVIDFNPNHSSDEHPWFTGSVEGEEPYKDYYVWADSPENDENKLPNNWLNVDGDPAWVWNDKRKQFYLATFGRNKPDLNLRNDKVVQHLKDILKFWLEKGVDGFKVIAASHLVEDESLRDEPLAVDRKVKEPQYGDINHIYTVDQSENLGVFAELREMLNNFTASTGLQKIFLAETSGSFNSSILYYGNETYSLVELPINTHMTQLEETSSGFDMQHHVAMWSNKIPPKSWPTLPVGNKNVKRLASRVGSDLVDGVHMVSFLAKGTPITYYGDELGVSDVPGDKREMVMLWSNETNGGFSNTIKSAPLHPDFQTVNVQVQETNKQSHMNIYKRVLALRHQPAVSFGLQEYPLVTKDVFSMIRVRKGSPGYLVVMNVGGNSTTLDFTGKSGYLPDMARVEIRSQNLMSGTLAAGDHPKIPLNNVPLEPKQAVVFSFVPIFEG